MTQDQVGGCTLGSPDAATEAEMPEPWNLWHKSVATFTGKNTITPWKTNMALENQP